MAKNSWEIACPLTESDSGTSAGGPVLRKGKVREISDKFSVLSENEQVSLSHAAIPAANEVRRLGMNCSVNVADASSAGAEEEEKGFASLSSLSSITSRGFGTAPESYSSDQYSSLSSGMSDTINGDSVKPFVLPSQGVTGTKSLGVTKGFEADKRGCGHPDDLESRSDFSASDDGESDSSGISKGSPKFVRSYNRRVRTRDYRGKNLQRLRAIRVHTKHKVDESSEGGSHARIANEQNNNNQRNGISIINSSLEDVSRPLQARSPSYSEASSGDRFDSDTFEMCSPGSDDVFWGSDRNLRLSQDHVPGQMTCSSAPNFEMREDLRETGGEKMFCSSVRKEIPDYNLPSSRIEDEWPRSKDNSSGPSLLSRLSKSVNIKKKHKTSGKQSTDKIQADANCRENLEKIIESIQEKPSDSRYYGMRSRSLTPALDGGTGETDDELDDYLNHGLNVGNLGQRSHSLTPTFENFDTDDNDHSSSKEFDHRSRISDFKSQLLKPIPPPRSMKPSNTYESQGLYVDQDRDSHSSNESVNPPTSLSHKTSIENASDSPSSDLGRLRSVSNTFCNLWPQFFSGSTSNPKSLEKDDDLVKKNSPKPEPSSNISSLTKQLQMSLEALRGPQGDLDTNVDKSKGASPQQNLSADESHKDLPAQKLKIPERRCLPQQPQSPGPGRRVLPPKPQAPTRSSSYAPQPPAKSAKPIRPQIPVRSSSYRPIASSDCTSGTSKVQEQGHVQNLQFPGYAPQRFSSQSPNTNAVDPLKMPHNVSDVGPSVGDNTESPKKDSPAQKKKLFSNFPFYPETSTKKMETDKSSSKDKKVLKEKKIVVETQPRIRRTGAVKKSDDQRFHSPTSLRRILSTDRLETRRLTDVRSTQSSPGSSTDGGSRTGAIPKSSYLNKTFHIMNRDLETRRTSSETKIQDSAVKSAGESPVTGSAKSVDKPMRGPGKRGLDRSVSVPFWTKLSLSSGDSVKDMEVKVVTETKPEKVEEQPPKESKDVAKLKLKQTTSSPSNSSGSASPFLRKASHKRTRSHDVTKTFKEDFKPFTLEKSASHDNLANLKENQPLDMPVLAVEFASPESPPQMEFKSLRFASDTEGHSFKSSQKHRSCNNIIDINGDVLEPMSPKFARAFKDSKLKSASAFCLTNAHAKRATSALRRDGGEDSCPSGESTPPWPPSSLMDGDRANLRSSQQLYISPYELTTHARDKPYFHRLMGMFHVQVSDSKMDSLVQQLDLYSRQGIPKQPHLLACQTYELDQEVVVEDSWRTLVEGHEHLDDRQEQQQSAIWELVETEATYIHMLKVITDLFLSCLCNLQNESLLCEIDTDKLFSNVQEIYNANLTFWREHIGRMLEVARSSRQPLDPTLLSDGFYKFDELFNPYTRYCLDQSHCQQYCKEKDHDNEYFKMYLAWCETQKECNRLRLVDIIVQPMQRLTKYSLLLKAILKKTNPEDHKLILHDMVTHVENFVSNVNSALRNKHEQERLRDIAKRIEAYEAVEARDDELEKVVKTYSDLSLTQPMPGCPEHLPRHILHHGDLRLRDPHSSKMDVHVFLFTDLLLITKVTQRKAEKVKVIRPPYHVERLILVDLKDTTSLGLVSINEWNVAVAAFTLQCPDQRTHRTWHDAIKRAKEQYKEAQQARDVMIYDDMSCVGHLAPRSPRPGSSRASRVSSLAHSHSGSIDLNEHSPASTHHPPSLDMGEIRASSASSDDSIAPAEAAAAEIQRSKSLESGGYTATSPRPDRRPAFPKTPNTLSVIPPYSTGQSLPNLTVESAHSLRVPNSLSNNPKALSAGNRGVSYPPPSPRTLRRSAPVPQSRNPPLIKTRHVTSMVGSPQELDHIDQEDSLKSGTRRISRTDRMDNRRYHTAGAIDDIKKQDTKDATIHKRLSWNYGQGPPPTRDLGNDQGKLGRHKQAIKSISCESMHSSSGVSSTSSLHRSMGSELETLENIDDNELEDGESTVVDLTVSDCTSLKISPHISTTYICHDSDITLGVCSQYITQPNSAAEPSEGCENLVKIDVSETDPGISSVQITVTEGTASSSSLNLSSSPSEGAPSRPDNSRMREILLNDASVEASDV